MLEDISSDENELIDTLWNVNQLGQRFCPVVLLRINRYIMECKYNLGGVLNE